jgi:hypothetical protein
MIWLLLLWLANIGFGAPAVGRRNREIEEPRFLVAKHVSYIRILYLGKKNS